MLRFRMKNSYTIRVTGIDLSLMSKIEWRRWLDDLGRRAQTYIAIQWDIERTGTGRQLRPNSAAWTARKIAKGWSPKRGTRKGILQRAIEGARLYVVSAITPKGTAEIRFLEARLIARVKEKGVNYLPYYVAAKVPVIKRVLQLNQAALAIIAAPMLADLTARQITRRPNFRDRPAYIRPGLGLTQSAGRRIVSGLTPAQIRAVERMIR